MFLNLHKPIIITKIIKSLRIIKDFVRSYKIYNLCILNTFNFLMQTKGEFLYYTSTHCIILIF